MTDPQQTQHWVSVFADSVMQQTEALRQGDHRTGNKHAKRRMAAFGNIRSLGDTGRDAMLPLLSYSSIKPSITGSTKLTVRDWLRTRTYEEAREFGLLALEKVSEGVWP